VTRRVPDQGLGRPGGTFSTPLAPPDASSASGAAGKNGLEDRQRPKAAREPVESRGTADSTRATSQYGEPGLSGRLSTAALPPLAAESSPGVEHGIDGLDLGCG
jgi:hypothetical protein